MITRAGLAVLDALSTGRKSTPQELVERTEYSRAHIYDILDDLQTASLVTETRGTHNQRHVQLTEHPVVESYRALVSTLDHVEWATILTPATLRVCWYLDSPRRVRTIADRLQLSRQSVHKALSPLKDRAMLSPTGPAYALASDMTPLLDFARSIVTHEHRSRVRETAPSATVEWCDPVRALVRVHTPEDTTALQATDEWQVTGLAQFQAYGLQFYLAGEPAFWYAPAEALSPEDVVCHTLALGLDSRRVSYTMLLIEALGVDRPTLRDCAKWYDLAETVAAILTAIDDGLEDTIDVDVPFPSPQEYTALKSQYEVA